MLLLLLLPLLDWVLLMPINSTDIIHTYHFTLYFCKTHLCKHTLCCFCFLMLNLYPLQPVIMFTSFKNISYFTLLSFHLPSFHKRSLFYRVLLLKCRDYTHVPENSNKLSCIFIYSGEDFSVVVIKVERMNTYFHCTGFNEIASGGMESFCAFSQRKTTSV